MIVADAANRKAMDLAEALTTRGVSLGATVVVIGGDGFLLRTIRERGLGETYLGLHAGRLGFLLNDPGADPDVLAERLTTCVPTIRELPVLEATADGAVATAVNDVVFERASHATAHLALTVDGETVLDPLAADGLIVSTPQGSTAYSLSAGGPPLHPDVVAMVVTPICPHLPRLRPFVLGGNSVVTIAVRNVGRRPVRAVVDGIPLPLSESVTVRLRPGALRLAYLPGEGLSHRLVRKVLRT